MYVHTDNKIIILPHNKGLRSSYYFLTEISNWFCGGKIHIFTQLVIQSQITENVSEFIYSFRYQYNLRAFHRSGPHMPVEI
jgi:hypothetical protein